MKYIKLLLAGMLLVCLFPMPYGYYTLVRFAAMVVFAFLAYSEFGNENKATPMVFTYGALALLFQPFVKIVLGRGIWNILDVVVALLLIYLWYKERKDSAVNRK